MLECMIFEILAVVSLKMGVFWVVMLCHSVCQFQTFWRIVVASSAIIVVLTECQQRHTQYCIFMSQKKLIFGLEAVPIRPKLFTAQGCLCCSQENMTWPSVLSICYFVVLSQLGVSHYTGKRIHNTRKMMCLFNVSAPQIRYFCCAPVRICNSSDALHWVSSV